MAIEHKSTSTTPTKFMVYPIHHITGADDRIPRFKQSFDSNGKCYIYCDRSDITTNGNSAFLVANVNAIEYVTNLDFSKLGTEATFTPSTITSAVLQL